MASGATPGPEPIDPTPSATESPTDEPTDTPAPEAAPIDIGAYQIWIDTMRACMAEKGHDFVLDIAHFTAPDDSAEDGVAVGFPGGLSAEQQHQWIIDAYSYDLNDTTAPQGTWETACITPADAASGLAH